jgi:aminoglycoside phosphotransferase (APT) family kinase protein
VTSDAPVLAELEQRIRAAFPELAYTQAELNDYGDDNQVVVLDRAWVVRFPRNDEYRARFAAERNLLATLRGPSSVRVPHYEFVAPDGSFGAYRLIAGTEMTPPVFHALDAAAQRMVLTELAGFLTVLHALPPATIAQPDGFIPQTWSGEQFAALYRGMRRAKIARAVDAATLARFDAFHDAFEKVPTGVARLVHDDISDDHILIADGRLAGIIDFSDASFGDAAIDVAWFWRLGEAAVDTVLGSYPLAPQDPGLKSRSHWTFVRYLINQMFYGAKAKWNLSPAEALAQIDLHLTALGF